MHRFIHQPCVDPHPGNPIDQPALAENSAVAVSPDPLFGWSIGPDGSDFTRAKLLDEMLKIHEYERQRLGQELHDSAGQLVVALQLSIAQLKILEEHSGHEDLIEDIQDTVRQIDREIRSLAFLHYPAELGDRDLPSAVRALANGFGRRTGIETTFKAVGKFVDAKGSGAMALLRVAQEALVNIHRHAHASSASIILQKRGNEIELSIADDGVGIPAKVLADAHGIGLQGMRHRVEMLGGRFRVRNLLRGTKIFASVPEKCTKLEAPKPQTVLAQSQASWLTMLG
ncbi:MAG TPA: ATP-binding protein [Sphingomicrobium sp.]|nr:ATP-binding protein [Sphingomicrobium sp.]